MAHELQRLKKKQVQTRVEPQKTEVALRNVFKQIQYDHVQGFKKNLKNFKQFFKGCLKKTINEIFESIYKMILNYFLALFASENFTLQKY